MRYFKTILVSLLLLMAAVPQLQAQSLEAFEQRVTEFTLDNGLHFIIIQRDVAPVATFVTFGNIGAVDEPVGQTGITHIFEHMAFKGTHTIGTTDIEAEMPLIQAQDDAYRAWHRESTSHNPDEELVAGLWAEFERLRDEAQEFVVNNEFSMIIDREGAVGMNAFVSADATGYFYSLPQNRAELWFKLESDRFMNPVMREFYQEKDVIWEERRDRTDNNPIGRLIEEFNSIAFSAHPYRNPPIGWPSDIDAVTIRETLAFYDTYFIPQNLTMAIAGDVDPAEMRRLAEKYFGSWPAREDSPRVVTVEPPQRGERRFTIEDQSQPILMIGYKSVDEQHPDFAPISMLASILFDGRTSRMYRSLVVDEQLALQVQGFNGFPGTRFPGLFLVLGVPNAGVETAEIEQRIYEEIERIQQEGVTESELERVRTQARASTIRGLRSNMNIALSFAETHARTGDWRNTFRDIDRLSEVTVEDIQRVAQEYLIPRARTVGKIINAETPVASESEN
ncbi:putative Zn-dependent peptidase [Cyclonatronum proteinivorum]|uniref:Putative Zn-dependent peptidase n=1 Tax=Cyclonatronum proteinivorum TaxID=1457365 RepID=A0A345ULF1_9BACT|nr:pitrilysin family protein [Cyclonatronum proteinivorum]AXJ01303.1 putative Zn-dependent peptidase [Cyclonatronum proteinivorum]